VRNLLKLLAAAALASCLCAPAALAQTLVWDPSPGPAVTGYTLHVGYASGVYEYGIDVGPGTSLPLPPLAAGRTHYFAVSAYDASGRYSAYSNEVVLSRQDAERVPLAAAFTAEPVTGTAPLTVRFVPSASGAIASFRWDFGDGSGGVSDSSMPLTAIAHTYDHAGTYPVTFTVAGPAGQRSSESPTPIRVLGDGSDDCPCSLWESGVPTVADDGSSTPITVGLRFATARNGIITAIRFYRSPANVGPHLGELWTTTGGHLGAVVFAQGTPPGWQEARFATPIPVVAGEVYVATYHAPNGHVARSNGTFLKGVAKGPLLAPAHRISAPNGAFAHGPPSTFPRDGDKQANFWVDVVFVPASATSDRAALPASPRLVQ